jgi:hypothetical protein
MTAWAMMHFGVWEVVLGRDFALLIFGIHDVSARGRD